MFLVGANSVSYGVQPEPGDLVDLVLVNETIATVDGNHPNVQALAVRGDEIVAVGTNEEIRSYVGSRTRMLDLTGKVALPGFIDGHAHLVFLGHSKMELDLAKARNWDEVVSIVKEMLLWKISIRFAIFMQLLPGDCQTGRGSMRVSGSSRNLERWIRLRGLHT